MYYEKDVQTDFLDNKAVAIIGYGNQGKAQAKCLRDSGINVIIGARENGLSYKQAISDDFTVMPISLAAEKADIVHLLIPDECQGSVFIDHIKPYLTKNKTLSFSHGFSIIYKTVVAPDNLDVILIAPKSPGSEVRKKYNEGFGVPGLIAVEQDITGSARMKALCFAYKLGLTRAGVLECSFAEETYEDLFGEQNVLCGGLFNLMKSGFEVLTEAGYPAELAYFETVHEVKLIVDLIYEGGIEKMSRAISNTAEWGMYTNGDKIINKMVKEKMKKSLASIQKGQFAKAWLKEYNKGMSNLLAYRRELCEHPMEKIGKKIRNMYDFTLKMDKK